MRILGIDPGYAIVGYGIIEAERGKYSLVDYGAVETSSKLETPARLIAIEREVMHVISEFKPDEIAIEELFFNTNITTGIKVAQARGVIVTVCAKMCDRLYEYTPLQIKSTVTGNGTASKQQVEFMVKSLLKLKQPPKPDDAADALAAALCHALSARTIKRGLK